MTPTGNDDLPREGASGPLSDSECEQLLAGQTVPGSDVGSLFRLIDAADPTQPLPGEAAAMAAFRESHSGSGVAHRRFTARVATVALAGSVVLAGGVAAAATGHLHSIEHAIGVGHSHPAGIATPHVKPEATPPAPGSDKTPPAGTKTPPAGSKQQGKAHQGNGKGKGVGETAHPTHPTHPAHPSQAATPSHSPKPSHTPSTGSTHSPKPKHTPSHNASPNPNSTKSPSPNPNSTKGHRASRLNGVRGKLS